MARDPIRQAIRDAYDSVGREGATAPKGLSFPTGGELARALGYRPARLDALPRAVLEAFVGAAALAHEVDGPPGVWVVDLGCGAGLDSLLLAHSGFRVAALDASGSMLGRLSRAAAGTPPPRPHPIQASLPLVPLRDDLASWVLLNGVANLIPERDALLREVHRVLRTGGTALIADVLVLGEVPEGVRDLPEAWAWCLGGAATPAGWRHQLAHHSFERVEIEVLEEFPPFARGLIRTVKEAAPHARPPGNMRLSWQAGSQGGA